VQHKVWASPHLKWTLRVVRLHLAISVPQEESWQQVLLLKARCHALAWAWRPAQQCKLDCVAIPCTKVTSVTLSARGSREPVATCYCWYPAGRQGRPARSSDLPEGGALPATCRGCNAART